MSQNKDEITLELENSSQTPTRPKIKRPFKLAVVGATGIVGKELISILAERKFPVASLKLLASKNSAGQKLEFKDDEVVVEELNENSFEDVELAFFAVSNEIALKFCKIATQKNVICIDKSSAHRLDKDIPMVVPEVNPETLADYNKKKIVASPNCAATPLAQVLHPLNQTVKIKRVVVSTYQSVSGAGQNGIGELDKQTRHLFNMKEIESPVFKKRIAFNVLPCIPATADARDDLKTDEEVKLIFETKRLLSAPDLKIAATCVRVPVFNGHSESVNIEFEDEISANTARDILSKSPNIAVVDNIKEQFYPTPIDCSGEDVTLVGRIRKDDSVENGISLWICSDNLRTGAALNAVRIAETLCSEYL